MPKKQKQRKNKKKQTTKTSQKTRNKKKKKTQTKKNTFLAPAAGAQARTLARPRPPATLFWCWHSFALFDCCFGAVMKYWTWKFLSLYFVLLLLLIGLLAFGLVIPIVLFLFFFCFWFFGLFLLFVFLFFLCFWFFGVFFLFVFLFLFCFFLSVVLSSVIAWILFINLAPHQTVPSHPRTSQEPKTLGFLGIFFGKKRAATEWLVAVGNQLVVALRSAAKAKSQAWSWPRGTRGVLRSRVDTVKRKCDLAMASTWKNHKFQPRGFPFDYLIYKPQWPGWFFGESAKMTGPEHKWPLETRYKSRKKHKKMIETHHLKSKNKKTVQYINSYNVYK